MDDEQEAYNNLPESLQESDKGNEMEENIATMQNVLDDLTDITDRLQELL